MKKLPNRKPTRLPDYDYSTPAAYFITICSRDRAPVFSKIDVGGGAFDAPKIILSPIGDLAEKYILSSEKIPGVSIDKYIIMPNHIHLLLSIRHPSGMSWAPSPTTPSVSHIVSTLKRFVNRDAGGNVFQRSFYDHIVRGEEDYREIWEYIENNPARWAEDEFYCK